MTQLQRLCLTACTVGMASLACHSVQAASSVVQLAEYPIIETAVQTNSQPPQLAAKQSIELNFAAEIAGKPFDCASTYDDIGKMSTSIAVSDFRLYISELVLHSEDGRSETVELVQDGRWQYDSVALLDFENGKGRCDNGTPQLNNSIKGTVPAGSFTAISFSVGIPFDLNHADPTIAASPLNLSAMFWSWRGGYRFLKIDTMPLQHDGAVAGESDENRAEVSQDKLKAPALKNLKQVAMTSKAGEHTTTPANAGMSGVKHGAKTNAWMLHLGSTGCQSSSRTSAPENCSAPNRIKVRFNNVDLLNDVVIIDPAAVLSDSDVSHNAANTSPGCMSFPGDADCSSVLPKLGLAYGEQQATKQQLLTIRQRTQ